MNESHVVPTTDLWATPMLQAALLYERAVTAEETAERHVLLAEALVLAERKNEALWHYGRAANLCDDRQYKARGVRYTSILTAFTRKVTDLR